MAEIETTFRIAGDGYRTLAEYLLFRRHLFAYEQAIARIPTDSVVADVGCGYGYALQMLTDKAKKVYAIDAADTALDSLPDLPKVHKIKAYADSIPLDAASVDIVIAFQLLEHVAPDRVVPTLEEFLRILRPAGRIFATTPNSRWRLFKKQALWNPYHTREYTADELKQLCQSALHCNWQLKSVVGRGIAQKIEIARVSPNPIKHFGPRLSSYALRVWQVLGPMQLHRWRKVGKTDVESKHRIADWFDLSHDPRKGLDLWLEVTKT